MTGEQHDRPTKARLPASELILHVRDQLDQHRAADCESALMLFSCVLIDQLKPALDQMFPDLSRFKTLTTQRVITNYGNLDLK